MFAYRRPPLALGQWSGSSRHASAALLGLFGEGSRKCGNEGVQGNRHFSSRRRAAGSQRLTNDAITAENIMLVMEKDDGSTEKSIVSRKQALEAAISTNLDLVQVNGAADPVVCKLMNLKVEEYRRKRLVKDNTKKKRGRKEIRMKGMISGHDFDRKVNDVKKHLDRGDVVKVVFDAPTSVLKRSLHCLDDLQTKFEELMDPSAVNMKLSHGANALSRREFLCMPKFVKSKAKPKLTGTAVDGDGGTVRVPSSHRVNDHVVDGLRAEVQEEDGDNAEMETESEPELESDSEMASGVEDIASDDEEESDHNVADADSVFVDLDESMLWEMEDCSDFNAERELAEEWDRFNTRKSGGDLGQAQSGAKPNGGSTKGGGRKSSKWSTGNDSGYGGGGEGSDYSRRERPAQNGEGGGAAGRGRGPSRGGSPGSLPWRGGGGRGSSGGEGRTPPPVRSTPYKWGTTNGDRPDDERSDGSALQQGWSSKNKSQAASASGAGDRSFSARFGGGAERAGDEEIKNLDGAPSGSRLPPKVATLPAPSKPDWKPSDIRRGYRGEGEE